MQVVFRLYNILSFMLGVVPVLEGKRIIRYIKARKECKVRGISYKDYYFEVYKDKPMILILSKRNSIISTLYFSRLVQSIILFSRVVAIILCFVAMYGVMWLFNSDFRDILW